MSRTLLTALATATVLAASAAPAAPAAAQELDRSARPAAGPMPGVAAPTIEKQTLKNGLELWVVTQRELPIVDALLMVRAGSALDAADAGLAQMTASLLDEGTAERSALEFSNALDLIGAELGAYAGDEQTMVSLLTLKRHADSAFSLLGEMVTTPAFQPEEIERERKTRLQALRQQKDRPAVIASQLFGQVVYGADHPYGRPSAGTLETVEAITREDITGFYGRLYRPNNAVMIVVGDVTAKEIAPVVERALAGWKPAPIPAEAKAVPEAPAARATAVYLVDKPGAAQSEIRIGHVGAARSASPDYYALQVLNTALGGAFSSRINLNLREEKGFTYGARSSWGFNRGEGPFVAQAGVFTAKTDSSLVEFLKELREVRDARPLTAEETEFAKASLVRAYPRRIETAAGVANVLADIAFFGLPDSEITAFLTKVQQVTPADVTRVAREYIDPEHLTVVVVGDLATIRPAIEALDLGPVTVLTPEGDPVAN